MFGMARCARAQGLVGRVLLGLGRPDLVGELLGSAQQGWALVGAGLGDVAAERLLLGAQGVGAGDRGAAGVVGGEQRVDERFVGPAGALRGAGGSGSSRTSLRSITRSGY